MKYKVSELEGPLLDEAVAKMEGGWKRDYRRALAGNQDWVPSTDWKDAGPILERNMEDRGLQLLSLGAGRYEARHGDAVESGPTLLIAALRAYVAGRFGDEVELP